VGDLLLLLQDPRVRHLRREALWVGLLLGVALGGLGVLCTVQAIRVLYP
jgi:hypothetical protein